MGNFSRDPQARLADAIAKHYIGVRLQQGVPIVDADWNELEDLRRHEFENLGSLFIGNGVPVGNDGFRMAPIAGGGVNTIVLISKSTGVGASSVQIDLTNSTAAAALGFEAKNFKSARFGSSPAQLTGNKTQPFNLTPGSTLVVQAENRPPENVTFTAGGFANIAAATAAEVVAAIAAATTSIMAKAGAGNDFIITGGDGTSANAGRILVEGQMALNETDLKYTEQPLYKNNALANAWGVVPVTELVTPTATEPYVIYLDVWNREVDSNEDLALVDDRIGVETANRLRREWAVRVARRDDFPGVLAAKPAGHSFYKLAQLDRPQNQPAINPEMIRDQRETELSIRSEIAFREPDGNILINSETFRKTLMVARDNFRGLIDFLATKFVAPGTSYLAGEVIGIEALSVVAGVADQGIALENARALNTKGALRFFRQLLEAETRFVNIWETAVLPINKAAGKIYEVSYKHLIGNIKTSLTGPSTPTVTSLADALAQDDLLKAVRAQERINSEVIGEVNKPTGTLLLKYLGSPRPDIPQDSSFDVRYQLSGSITPEDDVEVEVFIDPQWTVTLKNADHSVPLALRLGPSNANKEFIMTVRTPDIPNATIPFSVKATARRNRAGLFCLTAQKNFQIGAPPPPSEQSFAITIDSIDKPEIEGVFQVPVTQVARLRLLFSNNTDIDATVNIEFALRSNTTPPSGWQIGRNVDVPLTHFIAALGNKVIQFDIKAPSSPGVAEVLQVLMETAGPGADLAEAQVSFISVT